MSKRSRILGGAVALAAILAGNQALAFNVSPFPGVPAGGGMVNGTAVPAPGYPDFWSYNGSATLTQGTQSGANSGKRNNQNFTFTYTDVFNAQSCPTCAAVFNFPAGAYAVGNLSLSLTAIFAPSGQFLSGSYSIYGSLPPWSSPTYGSAPSGYNWTTTTSPLFTATLTGANVNMQTDALGFTTSNFGGWANQPQFTGGSTHESVWLYAQLGCQTANQSQPLCSNSTSYSFWNSFLAQLKNDNLNITGSFHGLASIATVPIPAAALLFGSGLAGLGAALRRRKAAVAAA